MIWGLSVLVSGRGPVWVDLRNLRVDWKMMGRILRVTLPAIIQRGTPNLAMSILMRLVSAYGAPAVAAWTVTQRIFSLATIPCMGLYRSTGAMVGQNLGARQPDRAERAVRLIARAALLLGVVILALLAAAAPQVMAWFSDDPETIQAGTVVLRAFGLQMLALNTGFVFDGGLGGAGDTMSPMVLNLISIWLVQVPLAFLLPGWLGLDAYGVWIALTTGRLVQWLLMWLRFNQGKWKLQQI